MSPSGERPCGRHVRERLSRVCLVPAAHGGCRSDFHALGAPCSFQFASGSAPSLAPLHRVLLDWLAAFECRYSRFLADSLITQINDKAGGAWIDIDPFTEALFALCDDIHFRTDGAFDPTSLPLTRLWDWAAPHNALPPDDAIARARALVGWRQVQRQPGRVRLPHPGMALDLGGIGKEFAVDQLFHLARDRGASDFLIDLGQDIRAHGRSARDQPWFVGVEDPRHPDACWCGLILDNRAVATSGNYRRCFVFDGVRYGHILDPRTGRPAATDCLAVTAVAPTCTEAGILSTTALVAGSRAGLLLIERAATAEGALWTTAGQRLESRLFDSYVAP